MKAEITHDLWRKIGRPVLDQPLVARSSEAADPWSHSGQYGLGQFPWHTDGAIDSEPPRYMILECVQDLTNTPTELLVPDPDTVAAMRSTTLTVRDRWDRKRYLPAYSRNANSWRLRWDPRVATPNTEDRISSLPATHEVKWSPGVVLVVDNFHALHRRPSVATQGTRVLNRYYIRSK